MQAWIPITIAAAFAQNLRFMLQKKLRQSALSTTGATFARFIYSAPLVAVLMSVYLGAGGQSVTMPGARFFAFAFSGGLAQILATMCVVALFAQRNFAVGVTFKKTEVLQTAIIGFVVLGEGVGRVGTLAIAVGFAGLLFLSDATSGGALGWRRFFNRAAGLGLLSGVLFAISAIGYRGAALELGLRGAFANAGFTLAVVTAFQSVVMAVWLILRDRAELARVFAAWRVGALVGITSMIGSFCWFTAFALQNAALVKALGQVELLFSYAASIFVFREKVMGREVAGSALLLVSILVLVLYL